MSIKSIWVASLCTLGLLAASPVWAQAPSAGDTAVQQEIATAKDLEAQGRFSESIPVWNHLADRGNAEAQAHLGMLEYYGFKGMCPNTAFAVERLQVAAKQGYAEADFYLGEIYASDPEMRDPAKALEWYRKGAELGDAASQAALFTMLWNGKGVPRDASQAVHWLEKAADQTRPRSMFDANRLGDIYSEGKDVPQNDDKAIYWYLKAANGGLVNAQRNLAKLYEKRGDYAEAYRWYAFVAAFDADMVNQGAGPDREADVAARDRMAVHLTPEQLADAQARVAGTKFPHAELPPPEALPMTRGCPAPAHAGLTPAQQELADAKAADAAHRWADALRLWMDLAKQGLPEAETHIGVLYQESEKGVCQDDAKSVEWLTKAADQGYVEAYRHLGDAYSSYINPTSALRDDAKALKWYKKAADLGDAEAQYALYDIYWYGRGVAKNPAVAVMWLEKAARQSGDGGIIEAFDLGEIYGGGQGLPKNDDKAIYWYLQAANAGLGDAQLKLGILYEKRRDYVDAYKWYALVAAGDADRTDRKAQADYAKDIAARDRVAAAMSPAQLDQAKAEVAQSKITPFELLPQLTPATPGCLPPPPPPPLPHT